VAEIYPKSKFLILIRDPRDQILSRILLGQIRNEKKRNYLLWAYVWNYKYNTLLSKAVKIEENRFLKIKYEDLILNPEKELRKICGFFDISYNSQMLDYDENFKKLGNDINFSNAIKKEFLSIHSGLLKKVDSKKIGLWKKGIEQKDANLIWTICGPLAERLGYKRDEHFVKQPLKLKEYFIFLMFYTKYIVTPKIYYPSPFFVKYFINYVLRKKINRLKK
jgi:protein-tyrosine sulfotransferase